MYNYYCTYLHREMTYRLVLDVNDSTDPQCDGIQGIEEGIEMAMEIDTYERWIPLRFTYRSLDGDDSGRSQAILRRYGVDFNGITASEVVERVVICGEDLCGAGEIRFRWMQEARVDVGELIRSDMWAIGSLNVTLVVDETRPVSMFEDNFGVTSVK